MAMTAESGESEGGPRPGWRTWAAVLALYVASVTLVTYPMVLHARTQLPSTVDPLQHLTVMRWYKACLLEGRSPFRDPGLQYPVGAPIGNFSPLHFQALLFVPLSLAGAGDVVAFNLVWFLGFLLTGLGTFALAWYVVRDRGCAAVAGLLAMFGGPMMMHSHAHLELITVGWFPIFLLAWLRFVDRPSRGRLAAAAASYVLVAMSAAYYAVFAVFPAALYASWRLVPEVRVEGWGWARRRLPWVAAFAGVAGGLVLAVFSGHIWAKVQGYSLGRPRAEFDRFGAPLWGYFVPTSGHWLGGLMPVDLYSATGTVGEAVSYLGIVSLLMIHHAAVRRVRFPRAGYWWAALGLMVLLSMGAHLRIGTHAVDLPGAWLWRSFFAFRLIRVPARFNLFAIVAAAVVAAAGLKHLLGRLDRRPAGRGLALAGVMALAVADLRTGPYESAPPPGLPACYKAIRDRDPAATFLEVPLASSGSAEQLGAADGYWQTLHGAPSTGGYSGQPNARFDDLMAWPSPFGYWRLAEPGYPRKDPEGLTVDLTSGVDFDDLAWLYLATHKLKYVVLHKWATTVGTRAMHLDDLRARLAPAKVFEDDITAVYESARLKPPAQPVLLCTEGWRQGFGWRGKLCRPIGREAQLAVFNPDADRPLTITLQAAAAARSRAVSVWAGGRQVASWRVPPGRTRGLREPAVPAPRRDGEAFRPGRRRIHPQAEPAGERRGGHAALQPPRRRGRPEGGGGRAGGGRRAAEVGPMRTPEEGRIMPRYTRAAVAIPVAMLFAFGLWFRVSSLEALPEPDGDEAWYAVQYHRLLHGEPFSAQTPHGNPLSPFHAAIEVPLLLAFRPSLWILRMPSVIAGILAVILTYALGARLLDRRTALMASALMAVLPVAIIASRTGYESCQGPLYGLLLIWLAHRRKAAGLAAGLAACYFFVHPTMLFLIPVLLAVFLAQSLALPAGDPARRPWRIAVRLAMLAAVGLGLGLHTLLRPRIMQIAGDLHMGLKGPHDPVEFLTLLGRLYFGVGLRTSRVEDCAFWLIVPAALLLGTERLIWARRWDRLAYVGGLLGSVAALFVMGGSHIVIGGATRFGYFLITPSVLASACLADALLVRPAAGPRATIRRVQYAGLLALGWGLLLGCRLDCLTRDRLFDGPPRVRESAWTLRTDERDPKQEAYRIIAADIDRGGDGRAAGAGHIIIAEDWWTHRPIQYLALERGDVRVYRVRELMMGTTEYLGFLRGQLQSGAYAVVYPGQPMELALKLQIPPGEVRSWDVTQDGVKCLTVFRREPIAATAAAAGPARFVEVRR